MKKEILKASKKTTLTWLFIVVFIFLFFDPVSIQAQNSNIPVFDKEKFIIEAATITTPINIDGNLNEDAWNNVQADTNFWLHYPVDTAKASPKTALKVLYDDKNLYIGVIFFDITPKPVSQSLQRDYDSNFNNSDNLTIVVDPANAAKSGYYFGINAAGAQADGTIYQNGMYPSLNSYWDNKWFAQTIQTENTVYFEIAIPFSTLKFNNDNSWGINFIRNDVSRNSVYSWTWFAANRHSFDLGSTGKVIFKDNLSKKSDGRFTIIPSVTGTLQERSEDKSGKNYRFKGGVDAKIAINNSLNLDLSVYPEFSNVSVDKQYIDFYQFEYYQPEQRNFFLENNDLFSQFGTYDDFSTSASESRVKPVYTRRLGLKDGVNVPIIYGARLSGEVMNNMRVGILSLQTESYNGQLPQNYFISSFQKGILSRSSIKGIFTNRNSIGESFFTKDDYNRTGGIEFDFTSKNGKFTANAKAHSSFSPGVTIDNMFFGGGFSYFIKNFKTQNWVEHVDKNYITDIGFVPRLYYKNTLTDSVMRFGYTHFTNKFEKYQYINNNLMIVMGEYMNIHTYLSEENKLNEFNFDIGYWGVFSNNYHFVVQASYKNFNLLVPHDIFDTKVPVPVGNYKNKYLFFQVESDKRKSLYFNVMSNYGEFYNGKKFDITAVSTYTFKPKVSIALTYNMSKIDLPEKGKATYHLIGLQPDISISKSIQWSNLLQYNTQKNNINFNSILKWRFAPMSDFYIIVKDDMFRSGKTKGYEVSFKLSYWFKV